MDFETRPETEKTYLSKVCPKCGETKPLEAFHQDRGKSGGKNSRCKPCAIEASRAWRAANPGRRRIQMLISSYGMTPEDWEGLFTSQGNVCAICQTNDPGTKVGWNTDHCHTTSKVRGITCGGCNRGLGAFKDNPDALRRAADYVEKHRNDPAQ